MIPGKDYRWKVWRTAAGAVVVLLVAVPVGMPLWELLRRGEGWKAWGDYERLGSLAWNTVGLVAGALAVAVPAGVAAAVLLYRTDLPLRRVLRILTILALFIPLPLVASAWQATLGTGGWLPLAVWNRVMPGDPDVSPTGLAWKPWAQGLGAAVWAHGMAALPWVILIVGQGLLWVEPELEEDALTVAGPWRVLWKVTLPRSCGAVLAATLWVGLQTAMDVTVTDCMQVRTFAEEVYTQFGLGDRGGLARAVAVALPAVFLTWAVVMLGVYAVQRRLQPLDNRLRPPVLFSLGRARGICLAGVLAAVLVLAGVPLASLLWKMGLGGTPPRWSPEVAWAHFSAAGGLRSKMVATSLMLAVISGAVVGGFGLVLCWLTVESRLLRVGTLCVLAAALALPGPVLGLGLKATIDRLLDWTNSGLVEKALYQGPSPLPLLWADFIRFLPFAFAALWPVVRLVPAELREAARADGARPGQELRLVVLPLVLPACLTAGVVLAALSLGELSAGKLVETPGSQNFAHEVFNLMHYGVTNDLAALCLLLVVAVLGLGGVWFVGTTVARWTCPGRQTRFAGKMDRPHG